MPTDATMPARVLVVMPNWVGDVVLATPALRGLRRAFPDAQIDLLAKPHTPDILAATPWHNTIHLWQKSLWRTVQPLRANRYDRVLLLPNSFKSAATAWLSGAKERIGTDRDGRGWLLTARLPSTPRRTLTELAWPDLRPPSGWFSRRQYAIESVRDTYVKLAQAAGAAINPTRPSDLALELATTPAQEHAADAYCDRVGLGHRERFALLNPGAAFGASKLWPAEHYAELARKLEADGLAVVVSTAPSEQAIAQRIHWRCPSVRLLDPPAQTIGTVKALARRCTVMITNDTGPRHFAIALGRPVVTLFGPTHQGWTDTGYESEIKLQQVMRCGPCQAKICPLGTTACMLELTPAIVYAAATELINRRSE